jgi:hypothetical protein
MKYKQNHYVKLCRQIGQAGFTAAQVVIHLSWNTCFSEQGKMITCSSGIKPWKHIEQGDPYIFWIISIVAAHGSGNLACFSTGLHKQTKRQ